MNRLIVSAATAAFLLVPASGAFAADGNGPLQVKGHPSNSQLAFQLPDHWRNDFESNLNRGVYGRDVPVGNAVCRVMILTRGESNLTGVTRTKGAVKLRFNGGNVSFRPQERGDGWYRSSTTVDPTVTPSGWKATGAAQLDIAEDPIVVLAQGHAEIIGNATDADRSQCAKVARGELARGMRTILSNASVDA